MSIQESLAANCYFIYFRTISTFLSYIVSRQAHILICSSSNIAGIIWPPQSLTCHGDTTLSTVLQSKSCLKFVLYVLFYERWGECQAVFAPMSGNRGKASSLANSDSSLALYKSNSINSSDSSRNWTNPGWHFLPYHSYIYPLRFTTPKTEN